MTIRDQVKAELDKVDDEFLGVVRRMIESLERRPDADEECAQSWSDFLTTIYGSIADAPIERGEQGELEVRAPLRGSFCQASMHDPISRRHLEVIR